MLHDIRDVGVVTLDAGVLQRVIQDAAGGTDERGALFVFHISRLFTDEHDPRAGPPLAEHRLGCGLVQGAAVTVCRGHTQGRE